ncbi:LrgB family protein [Tumebacillus sp. ITR2]|uniref:LrgB family protein n=1 Tax=Tumebacillus amylolyticus TaxID=2801339 RepID=A0ABS1JEU2_9BACL|nr:LrgB family protein [Tumebacillus amylolyticus]MBL0388078.1 LrgB family protein [Tumebacillus amylolyticus]
METGYAVLSLIATVLVYLGAKFLHKRWSYVWFSPLVLGPLLLILLVKGTHVSYASYWSGAQWLSDLLGPATVAFAVPLYKNWAVMKRHAVEIVSSIVAGSLIAVGSTCLYAWLVHLSPMLISSLAPRSVTTPIAMDISSRIGGQASLTAVFVLLTGITGSMLGPWLLKQLALRSSISRGVMLGLSAHGAGTAVAFSVGALEGTISSLSMILTAVVSLGLIPILLTL